MNNSISGMYPIHNPSLINNDESIIPTSSQALKQQEYEAGVASQNANEDVGFIGGIAHSALGTIARVRMMSEDPLAESKDYIPTDEERENILKTFNYNEDAYRAVVSRLNSSEDIPNAIKAIQENIEYNKAEANAGVFDNLASGFGDALVDPVNWAVAVGTGGMGFYGRVIGGAVGNVASGQYREHYTGVASNMMYDAIAGLSFGAGAELLSAASRKFYKQAWIESNTVTTNFAPNKGLSQKFFTNTAVGRKLKVATSTMSQYLSDGFNGFTVNGMLSDVKEGGALDGLRKKLVRNEAGILDKKTGVYKQYASNQKTVEEVVRDFNNDIYRVNNETADMRNIMSARGFSSDDVSEALYRYCAGEPTLPKHKPIENEVKVLGDYYRRKYDQDNAMLISSGKYKEGAIDKDNFVPRAFDAKKVDDVINTQGGKDFADNSARLYAKTVRNLIDGTRKNAKALQRVYEFYKRDFDFKQNGKVLKGKQAVAQQAPAIDSVEFRQWMEKSAEDTAMGIVDQGKHIDSVFDPRNAMSNIDPKKRIPWDTSYRDADGYCIDNLRVNFFDVFDRYHRRVGGEYASRTVLGVDGFEGMKKAFDDAINMEMDGLPLADQSKRQRYADASEILVKKAFGIGLRDYDEGLGVGTAISEVLRNLTFATSNTFMGLLNYTEVAAGVLAHGPSLLLKSIPGFNKVLTRWAKGGMKPEEERMVMDLLFTREPVVKSIWGDIRRHNRYRYGDHKIAADIVSGTQILANALPTTKFLQASQINIVDTARGMMLGQLIRDTKGGFFRKNTLPRLGITTGDMTHLKRQLKKAFAVDVKDGISVRDISQITRDPRALNTLRRLGDYVADETILRPSIGDTFRWDTSASPIIGLLTQFKSFALRSWSKRFIKSLNRVKEGDGLYQAANFSISVALATIGNLGITAIRTSGMSEEDKERYWEMALGVKPDDDIQDNLLNIVEASILRSSLLAAPSLLLNAAGVGTFAKTTSDARIVDPDAPKLWGNVNAGDLLVQNMPALRTANNYLNLGRNLADYLAISVNPDDYTYDQEQRNVNNLWRSFKSITPQWGAMTNIPMDYLKDEYTDLE